MRSPLNGARADEVPDGAGRDARSSSNSPPLIVCLRTEYPGAPSFWSAPWTSGSRRMVYRYQVARW